MRLKNYTFFAFLLFTFSINAQSPDVSWQKPFGGSGSEGVEALTQLSDGGYLFAGGSNSITSGNKTVNALGDFDYWMVRTDANGESVWQSVVGGTGRDMIHDMDVTDDGGFILGGESDSPISNYKSEDPIGGWDYWVVKTNAIGEVEWDKTIGGTEGEILKSIEQTSDGGYILGGVSFSGISGHKTEAAFGDRDLWIVKLDSLGNVEWDKSLGGDGEDEIFHTEQTSDGGYIVGSYSMSGISGNKTDENKGLADYWLVKLSPSGTIEWQKSYGGSDWDFLLTLQQTSDDGYIFAGQSDSPVSGDKTVDNHGGSDFWVVKTDEEGEIEWEKTIGGDADDIPKCVTETHNGGFIFGGTSDSGISGDKTDIGTGNEEGWIVMLDATGSVVWDKVVGTDLIDDISSIEQTSDRGYILGGFAGFFTGTGDSVTNFGLYDFFVVKLEGCPPTTANASMTVCNNYTDPNGETYDVAGNYTFTYSIPNSAGCDSLITVDLTVNDISNNTITTSSCDEYIAPSGAVFTESGIYTDVLIGGNMFGCDSVVTIDLTINGISNNTITTSACDEYIAPSGAIFTEDGVYTDVLIGGNMFGCDSVTTLDLTFISIDETITQNGTSLMVNEPNATYQWIHCDNNNSPIVGATSQNYSPPIEGNFAVRITIGDCVQTSECFNYSETVGVKDEYFETAISFFPNPTSDKVQIDLGKNYEGISVHVKTMLGKTIRVETINNAQKFEMNLPAENGIYLIQIYSEEGKQKSLKVIKI